MHAISRRLAYWNQWKQNPKLSLTRRSGPFLRKESCDLANLWTIIKSFTAKYCLHRTWPVLVLDASFSDTDTKPDSQCIGSFWFSLVSVVMSANRALKDPSEEPEIDQLSETEDIVTSYVFGMYDSSMNTHLHPRIESDWSPSKQDEVKFSFYAQSELQVPFCTGTETVITVVFLWHWIIWTVYSNSHKNYIKLLSLLQMNKKKCPLLERVCPLFKHFAQLGCRWLRGSSFCPLSSSGQEKGCFGVELGVFCVCTYLQKGCVTV